MSAVGQRRNPKIRPAKAYERKPTKRISIEFSLDEWIALVELVKNPKVKNAFGAVIGAMGQESAPDHGWQRKACNTIERADMERQKLEILNPDASLWKVQGSR